MDQLCIDTIRTPSMGCPPEPQLRRSGNADGSGSGWLMTLFRGRHGDISNGADMRVGIATDHGGFSLKEELLAAPARPPATRSSTSARTR